MKEYTVVIRRIIEDQVKIKAETCSEAYNEAKNLCESGKIQIDQANCVERRIEVFEPGFPKNVICKETCREDGITYAEEGDECKLLYMHEGGDAEIRGAYEDFFLLADEFERYFRYE